jgi:hypothetical protein
MQQAKNLLLHFHPFKKASKILRVKKADLQVKKDACESSIRELLTKLKDIPSCYKKTEGHYIKCDCVSKRQDIDQAVAYLAAVSQMNKREQDAL